MRDLPARVEAFRSKLVAGISCFPDTPECRSELESKSLPDLMVVYLNWANRAVPPRSRTVSYAPGFWDSPYADDCRPAILALAAEIENGSDLGPYLSEKVGKYGYMSRTLVRGRTGKGPEWMDKDFGLNTYDIHHLHLGPRSRSGRVSRRKELAYVNFTREGAGMVYLGDHKSFDDGSLTVASARWHTGSVNVGFSHPLKDVLRLHRAGITTMTFADGKVFIGTELATDGSSTGRFAQHIVRTMLCTDPQIDTLNWQRQFFEQVGVAVPQRPCFEWQMYYCDLGSTRCAVNTGCAEDTSSCSLCAAGA